MATSSVSNELFPFSTEDGKAIPLDIIRPLSIIRRSFLGAGVAASITIPATWKVATFYSNAGCIIQFAASTIPNPPLDDIEYTDALYVPPNCVVTSTILAGVARIISVDGDSGGYLIAQQIQKWAGLALRRQSTSI